MKTTKLRNSAEMPLQIMIIGLGPHAKRAYIPALIDLRKKYKLKIALVVELREKASDTKAYVQKNLPGTATCFVDKFGVELPKDVDESLTTLVKENQIDGVIISTEPLAHVAYAKWALKNNLHILMDKPISTHKNVVSDIEQDKKIFKDWEELNSLNKQSKKAFIVNVQRRYHPGFEFVFSKIEEISNKFNCPINAIQSTHCDGQWRLPNEIIDQNYHPYNSGYGKASHSGYHIFDTVYQFYKHSAVDGKLPDTAEIFSSLLNPEGFLYQLKRADYLSIFGNEYNQTCNLSDQDLMRRFKDFGEIDVSSIVKLKRKNIPVCNISINLMHNGFARRTWLQPGKDLYKGNGRVKHEYHNIEQGPFQNIQIHSYQSNDNHETNSRKDYQIGGNNHFDIYIFRNSGITGDRLPFEKFSVKDICGNQIDDSRLITEQSKFKVVEEFLDCISGKIKRSEAISPIEDHYFPVQLMAGVYISHNSQLRDLPPIYRFNYECK